ncbi:MAG TPA: hypothetical protein VGS41_03325 [Chthonomonadales bacterium]|nr:hypothetical protein [Chthonomonadales bacterium]
MQTVIDREPVHPDAREAQENLRSILDLMERSTRYSTFSGLSGIIAGLASIGGCLAARTHPGPAGFLAIWAAVIFVAIGSDYMLTKRRAARVGKLILSRLGAQMMLAAAPGLGTGALLTIYCLENKLPGLIYPAWMLCYGIAVSAVGPFSQREVSLLGAAFLLAGAIALFLPPSAGLPIMAASFGGFHIFYGLEMCRKDGW